MDERYRLVCDYAADNHAVISTARLDQLGVTAAMRWRWEAEGLLLAAGHHSYYLPGSVPSWRRSLAGAIADLGDAGGVVAGRATAQLYGLDGFTGDRVELLVPRDRRMSATIGVVRSTRRPLPKSDIRTVDGLRTLSPERMILDAPIFRFTRREIDNAIDSAVRLRLIDERRLRARALERHSTGVRGGRMLIDALIDTGGESWLERAFLALVRRAGLPRPATQRVYADGKRTIARVDFEFPGGWLVEVSGFGAHGSRRARQHDLERKNELALLDRRYIEFTYEHIVERPDYVVAALLQIVASASVTRVAPVAPVAPVAASDPRGHLGSRSA